MSHEYHLHTKLADDCIISLWAAVANALSAGAVIPAVPTPPAEASRPNRCD
jgi:hypothetical protein